MTYDVIISGAGIIGLATALKICESKASIKMLILEKELEACKHQTGHNSGVIHSGIYYRPGSLKAENCVRGYNMLLEFCNRHAVNYEICGKVIVATENKELPVLEEIYRRGIANGLDKLRLIDETELKDIEPYSAGIKAIYVPYTGIVDFRQVGLKYAELISNSCEIKFNEKVLGIKLNSDFVEVITQNCSFNTKIFINCSGLYSDEVARMSGLEPDVRIIPFRGEYYKLKDGKKYLVRNLIYPVPDPEFPFLGVHFTRKINGEIEAGPNAVLAFSKEGYSKTSFRMKDILSVMRWKGFYKVTGRYFKTGIEEFYRSYVKEAFVKSLRKLVPEINPADLLPGGSGVRAQAVDRNGKLVDDFIISQKGRIINVLNAPSPAATSSLAIGEKIAGMYFQSC